MQARIAVLITLAIGLFPASVAAQYKSEFKMSVVVNADTTWGRAATRFTDAVRYQTQGRIQIRNYFDARLLADQQTTEFHLLEQGIADFAIGSTINWSPQVPELNLFMLPFMFPTYAGLDQVEVGEPGKFLFELIQQKGVIPIAWGENGYREVTNSRRPIRRPEDLNGLNVRVVGVPIVGEIFHALGANPISMNWGEAQVAFRQGQVDGQENPIGLIIPYSLWGVHRYVTLWRYAIDPLILASSAKTWTRFTPEDRTLLQRVGGEIMAEQKKEARDGLVDDMTVIRNLVAIYGMEVVHLDPAEVSAFRDRTRLVYDKWSKEIGVNLVRSAEKIVEAAK